MTARSVSSLQKCEHSYTLEIALGGFLDQFPDRPPVPGYTTATPYSHGALLEEFEEALDADA